MDICVTKVKHNRKKGETAIHYTLLTGSNIDKHTIETRAAPHPSFLDALDALAEVVAEACEVRDEKGRFSDLGITVLGLTMADTAGEEGELVEGVTITALRDLSWANGPLVLNTPHSPVDWLPHADSVSLVDEVLHEAQKFVEGKRAQVNMFEASSVTVDPDGALV